MDYCSVTSTPQHLGNCLSNFNLRELLVLKKSLESMGIMSDDNNLDAASDNQSCAQNEQLSSVLPNDSDAFQQPQRMALMANERGDHAPHSGSGPMQSWHSDHHAPTWMEPKPSKLQTLFQISITALAFLSFGGYLLCLIVQAIKSKGTTYFHPVATATTMSSNGNVKRIKIYRRSKRASAAEQRRPLELHPLGQDYASYMKAMRGRHLAHAYLVGS